MRAFAGFRIIAVICALFFVGTSFVACAQDVQTRKTVVITPTADPVGARFKVRAKINDSADVEFYVDTGASGIAISYRTALALGLEKQQPAFWMMAMTASGPAPAPVFKLSQIKVGDIVVRDLLAGVLPPGVEMNLLGNTFLMKLNRFEYKDGVLTLEQ